MTIAENIRSIGQAIKQDYVRPEPEKVTRFQEALHTRSEAKDYLKITRGLTDETIENFKLGYDEERDAISIPIYKDKELVNIKYRFLNPKSKVRYSSERGAETWLFNDDGIDVAKIKGGVLVVEGEFDLMSCWQVGLQNVVSVASGKDSYGVWLELLDRIPKVYLALDNDEGGRQSSKKFAERVGLDKSFEVVYPEGIKDANEFFRSHDKGAFIELLKKAHPYYSHQFKGVDDIIEAIKNGDSEITESKWIPQVKMEKDWLLVLSGDTNVGKTTYSMNVVKELADKGIPVLVMPFERGVVSVGKRFLQVLFNKSSEDMAFTSLKEWEKLADQAHKMPVYFSTPKKNDIIETIKKARRFFDTRVVLIDHLDYILRHTNGNKENEISNTLQEYKRLGEELGIIFIVVTHVRKLDGNKPTIHDLKGSSSLYQDPEAVILLSNNGEEGVMTVEVAKNKGMMGTYEFGIDVRSGVMNPDPNDF